jgi:hypothetical protein
MRSRNPRWKRRFVGIVAFAAAVGAGAPPSASVEAESTGRVDAAAPVPGTPCRVLPADNIWNTDISGLPVHPRSDVWLRTMHAGSTDLHPDFGPPRYGMPFDVVGEGFPRRRIRFTYADESDPGPYPFGPNTPIEGGSDRHALVIDRDACILYELFAADWNDGEPTAGSGAIFDLRSNRLRPDGWTSADAAGLPIFPGLVRFDEVEAGAIRHAIRFTAPQTRDAHVWPARHDASDLEAWRYPPMGTRFRLKAGFSLEGFSEDARVILRAMKRYGLMLADNGTEWYFQGTPDDRWTNDLLDELKSVPARAFQAVDVRRCMVARNSGRADCPEG